MSRALIARCAGLLLLVLFAAVARAGDALLLQHARVLAPAGDSWRDDQDVALDGGKIVAIGPSGSIDARIAADLRRIDLHGQRLVPGLIDLHTHLLLHPYDETPWDEQVTKESLEARTIRATAAARATLAAGFTTIRELGTEGAGFADVALRDAIAHGVIPGPRIFAATRAIVAEGCYGPRGFDPRIEIPQGAEEVNGADSARGAARRQIAAGADWIKLYADYRRGTGAVSSPTLTLEEMRAAVDEAKRAGLKAVAHATTDAGIRAAIDAGVATIEHGTGASDATLALMRDRGVVLCPTLAASEAVARYRGWKPGDPEPERIAESRELMRRALASGVTIACGSDAGVFAHGTNAREIELMVAYGMTPKDALAAATRVAATVLGRADLGTIDVGRTADLVALDGDPLTDPPALHRVTLVVKDGHVAPRE